MAAMYLFNDTGKIDPATTAQPNIVILIADDLGWNDIAVYGNSSLHTPNIDRLAATGLRFDNAFLTTSSCSASRASILTGKYPHNNGLIHLHQALPAEETTLGLLFKQAGYHTEAIGKWHLGGAVKDQFSSVIDEQTNSRTERWIVRLQQRPTDKPFFYWLASGDPHRPHDTTGESVPYTYDPDTLQIPPGFVDGPGTRQELAKYYREVTRFDRDVGLVIAELEVQKVLDNTLVIVMSDNGRPFPGAKQNLYDDGIKTPFIIHWPKMIAQSGVRRQLISMVDLAPSLLEWAGLPIPASMQGYSFTTMLDNPESTTREYVYAERNWHVKNFHERAIRSLNYLYKENQFPLHGLCNLSPYSGTVSYKELLAAYRKGLLTGAEEDCFADVQAASELLSVDSQGITQPGNLVADEAHIVALETMRAALLDWRQKTSDFDYAPYAPAAKKK
jgi:N-sulfoglucosamine sulfohydrolase